MVNLMQLRLNCGKQAPQISNRFSCHGSGVHLLLNAGNGMTVLLGKDTGNHEILKCPVM